MFGGDMMNMYNQVVDDLKKAYKEIDDLKQELQRKDNIIKQTIGTIKELIDDSEDTTCYEITNTVKKLLLEELENDIK